MTASSLRTQSCKDLAQMARSMGLPGWHSMRKDELVQALDQARQAQRQRKARTATRRRQSWTAIQRRQVGGRQKSAKDQERLRQLRSQSTRRPAASVVNDGDANRHDRRPAGRDGPRPVLAARLLGTRPAKRRTGPIGAGPALARHAARPAVFRVAGDGTAVLHREIPIHGGVSHWYVDVQNPPQQFRMEIGYLTASGQFLLPGAQQYGDDAAGRHQRFGRRKLGRHRRERRPHLRHERRLLAARHEPGTARTAGRAAAAADGHADANPLRRRRGAGAGRRRKSCRLPWTPS